MGFQLSAITLTILSVYGSSSVIVGIHMASLILKSQVPPYKMATMAYLSKIHFSEPKL